MAEKKSNNINSITPYLGVGVGLRRPYMDLFLKKIPEPVKWVEVISENYTSLQDGTQKKDRVQKLLKIREHIPVALHSVSLSLGSVDPINKDFLKRLKKLINLVDPPWISDHLCFTRVHGIETHDLLPLPYTKEALKVIVQKIQQVQDQIKKPFLIENVSSYLQFEESEMSEGEFVAEVLKQSGCGILLDINNVFVSSVNHGFNPNDFLKWIPQNKIGQIHLAGHFDRGDILIDTHAEDIRPEVWKLFNDFIAKNGSFNTMIERDDQFPPWIEIENDLKKIEAIL